MKQNLFASLAILAGFALRSWAQAPDEATLIELRAAAPGILTAVVETDFIDQPSNTTSFPAPPPNLNLSEWRVGKGRKGLKIKAIYRYSIPFDGLAASASWGHPVKVRHYIYLEIGKNLNNGKRYRVSSPYGELDLVHRDVTTPCDAIKVNQGGYHPGLADRFANFGVFLGDGGSVYYEAPPSYSIHHSKTQRLIYEGSAQYLADDTNQTDQPNPSTYRSGEHVYRLSLGSVPAGGPYIAIVPGCGRSAEFSISMAAVKNTARLAMRGLYHQRCGIALEAPFTNHTRAICAFSHRQVADTRQLFTATTGNAQGWIPVLGTEPLRSIAGGWHDAGDFDRRVSHIKPLLWWLSYYEAQRKKTLWQDDGWLGIPESGNGVPDFLDEAMWALQSWQDLQITTSGDLDYGSVLAGAEANGHPGYGRVSAATDDLQYGTYASHEQLTAWSAGAFAQMARLWAPYDEGRAERLLAAAEMAWEWLNKQTLDKQTAATAYAAMQLYLTTGQEEPYHTVFKQAWGTLNTGTNGWPEQCLPQNNSAHCQFAQFAMYFHPDFRSVADEGIVTEALKRLAITAQGTGYHCDHPGNVPQEPYPQCLRAFGNWGAQVTTGLRTDSWIWAWLLLPEHPSRGRWFEAAALLSQYPIGLNPMNMSFYTGLGANSPRSSAHLDSYYTKFGLSDGVTDGHQGNPRSQVPGLLVFGPTEGRSGAHWERAVTDKLFPAWDELPAQRRWGDGWSAIMQNEMTSNNMAYQALLYTFLASIPESCVGPVDEIPANCASLQ